MVMFVKVKEKQLMDISGNISKMGGYPSGQREQTVNLLRLRYVGSNPTPPTINGALTLIGKGAVLKTASRRC